MKHATRISQKVFVFKDDGTFLTLLRTASSSTRPLKWDIPGGVYEKGEVPKDSVRREVTEETQLEIGDMDPITVEIEMYDDIPIVTIAYKSTLKSGEVVLSIEHQEFKWVTPAEFLELDSSDKWKGIVRNFLVE